MAEQQGLFFTRVLGTCFDGLWPPWRGSNPRPRRCVGPAAPNTGLLRFSRSLTALLVPALTLGPSFCRFKMIRRKFRIPGHGFWSLTCQKQAWLLCETKHLWKLPARVNKKWDQWWIGWENDWRWGKRYLGGNIKGVYWRALGVPETITQ